MKYDVTTNKIIIERSLDFDIKQILESGQIFRFGKIGDYWWCASGDKFAKIYERDGFVEIQTKTPDYFVQFFDLDNDYSKIKEELSKNEFMAKVISSCPGIRILKREMLDTIIEFIISANNNISRIRKIVDRICVDLGKNMGEYYAFPTMEALSLAPAEYFNSIGAGYRGDYLYKAVQLLKDVDFSSLSDMETGALRKYLISLPGIGPKVASCILLFGFGRKDLFPVDTWIEKVYLDHFGKDLKSREKIEEFFETMFGKNSGIAQQYLFYAKRENIIE